MTIRDRSIQEMRERLAKDFACEEVEDTIKYLIELGYLDDLRFATSYIESRNRSRPSGNYLLRYELSKKGIADEIIEQVMNSPEKEYELAETLVKQRLGSLEKIDALSRLRRLYGLLQRRGFPAALGRRVVGELLDRDLENDYN